MNTVDYLLKPIDEEELIRALEKLKTRSAPVSLPAELIQRMTQPSVEPARSYKEKVLVHQRNNVVMIDVGEVSLIYRDEIIFMLRHDGQTFVADYPSSDEVADVLDPRLFFRANRAQIINIQAVEGFRQDTSGKLHLRLKVSTPSPVEISREKAPQFRHWLDR